MKGWVSAVLVWMCACSSSEEPAPTPKQDEGSPAPVACRVRTCEELGATCGEAPNGCGGTMNCGACDSGKVCDANNQCMSPACEPKTCAELGASCGRVDDGCGGTVSCGACPVGQTCGAGGTANECAPQAPGPDELVDVTVVSTAGDCKGLAPEAPLGHVEYEATLPGRCGEDVADARGHLALSQLDNNSRTHWEFVDATSGALKGTAGGLGAGLAPQPGGNFHGVVGVALDAPAGTVPEHVIVDATGAVVARTPLDVPRGRVWASISAVPGGGSAINWRYRIDKSPDDPEYVFTVSRFDERGSLLWSAEYLRGFVYMPGPAIPPSVALDGSVLVQQMTGRGYDAVGRWIGADGSLRTPMMSFPRSNGVLGSVSRYAAYLTAQMLDGTLAVMGSNAPQTESWEDRWFAVLEPPEATSTEWSTRPLPTWLQSSPNTRVQLLPGDVGYAVVDVPHGDNVPSPCAHQIDLRSPSGQLCATVTLKVAERECSSATQAYVGMDGTVIQQIDPRDLGRECAGGVCTCVRRWWPGLLR